MDDPVGVNSIERETRHELKRYKTEYELTYDQAIRRLLDEAGWFDE